MLEQLKFINTFRELFLPVSKGKSWGKVFWNTIWREILSSIVELPRVPYLLYMKIYNELNRIVRVEKHNDMVVYLAENGYDILLYPLITNYIYHYRAMVRAIKHNYVDIVVKLIQSFPQFTQIHRSDYMVKAGMYGRLNIVKMMMDLDANDYNNTMCFAAMDAHMDMIRLMLEKGANNYNETMRVAAQFGRIEVVNLMLEKGANNYDETMKEAALYGYIRIVRKMLQSGATNYNDCMAGAACTGYMRIIKLMIKYGATISVGLFRAVGNGYVDIVKLMLNKEEIIVISYYKSGTKGDIKRLFCIVTSWSE